MLFPSPAYYQILPSSEKFANSLHLEEKKMTQTCTQKAKNIKRRTENAQKLEQRLKKQTYTEMEISCQKQRNCAIAKEPDNLGNQGCCLEAKDSVI